jgi:hypothetical protein
MQSVALKVGDLAKQPGFSVRTGKLTPRLLASVLPHLSLSKHQLNRTCVSPVELREQQPLINDLLTDWTDPSH